VRFLALLVLATGLAIPAASAQPEAAKSPGPTTSESAKTSDEYPQNELRGWQWANFILLLAILGYLGVRMGRPYFAGQTQTIRKDLEEARRRREEAERRMAEVQQKLNNLGAEIASFRQNVLAEQGVEADRMRKQAESDLIHVQQSASQQIETLGKHLRLELRRFASHLALELAEQRIRGRMTSDAQRRLNDRFIQDLRA
jgi:F-type H+-transporting ATPase subunit b